MPRPVPLLPPVPPVCPSGERSIPSPCSRPSVISRLLFLWVSPFINRNVSRPLEFETLLEIPDEFTAAEQIARLKTGLEKYRGRHMMLLRGLFWSIRWEVLRVFLISILLLAAGLTSPLVVRQLLRCLEGTVSSFPPGAAYLASFLGITPQSGSAIALSFVLFGIAIVSMISVHHLFFHQKGAATKAHTSLRGVLFEKAMRLARSERGEVSNGQIMSLMANDTGRVMTWLTFLHSLWYHPMQIALALVLLSQILGVAVVGGVAVIGISVAVVAYLVRVQNRIRKEVLRIVDKRVGITAEVVSAIRTVKFQGWEAPMRERITALRNQEVQGLRRIAWLGSLAGFVGNSTPPLALAVTFSIVALREGHLEASTVFPAMALILLLRFAFNHLPDSFNVFEAILSLSRIERFLARAEHQPLVPEPSMNHAISLKGVQFTWDSGVVALSVPELTIARGELVAVVGGVGGGKSALLLGLLNEIPTAGGSVRISAQPALVAQHPWVVSDTIRANIIAGRPYDEERYQRAIGVSALVVDLESFTAGDATIIGERGVNLSGGQRQRVALARAVYAREEIYLLDDPLSALDPAVANVVFDGLIEGELADTTRIMVTHRLEYALRADRVVVIEGGQIIEVGAPRDLIARRGRFGELIELHGEVTAAPEQPELKGALPALLSDKEEIRAESGEAIASNGTEVRGESREMHSIIDAEEREVGAVGWDVVRQFLRWYVPGGAALLLGVVVIGRHLATISVDLWLASFSKGHLTSVAHFILGYGVLVSILGIFHLSRWYLFLSSGLRAGITAHTALLRSVLNAPIRFFEANPVGRIVNRFSRDLDMIESTLPRMLLDLSSSALEVVGVTVMLIYVEPRAIIFLIPIFIGYYRIQQKMRPTGREAQRLESLASSPIFAHFAESLNGVDTVRSSGLASAFGRRLGVMMNNHSRASYSLGASARWVGLRLELLAALIILGSGISVALIPTDDLSPALAGLLLTYTITVSGAMNWFVRALILSESYLTSCERIGVYAAIQPESATRVLPPSHWPTRGEITFSSLTVRYRPELEPSLVDISLTIPAGTRVGIVGRTGSGKSTMIATLARFLPCSSGVIAIDGVDIGNLELATLRAALCIVPQEPVLFSGDLRDTLDPFGQATDAEIMTVLERVELGSFVRTLPGLLQYQIHEGGLNLSAGQRQLLCLARALLRGSKIIILDEATAAIDVETDSCIQRTIRREFIGCTVLVIAHRLGTVIDSDMILALERGRVAEYGSPVELLKRETSFVAGLVREMQRG